MIDFENLNEINFNMKAVGYGEAHNNLTDVFQSFCKAHDGEMWTSMLICMLYSQMEAVAHRYGYDFVSTRDKDVLYVRVVCA